MSPNFLSISMNGQSLTETGSVIDEGASLIVAASVYACEVTGSLGYTSYFTSCSFTLNLGKLVAEPAGLKSVAPENNVKGRIEYYDDGRIKRIVTIMKDPNKP